MTNMFWLGWPYTKWAQRFACCKAPSNKVEQEKIMQLIYQGEIKLPSEDEIIALSEKRWLAIENKCNRNYCKTIALDINGGYCPFENTHPCFCPGCGQPLKPLPITPIRDSGWNKSVKGRCISSYSRVIKFNSSVSKEKQLSCISWIYKNDNPGYYAWKEECNNDTWSLYSENDSGD